MVLTRYGVNTDLDTVSDIARTEWISRGSYQVGMTSPYLLRKAVETSGVRVRLRYGELDQLKYYVSCDKPVIVLLRSGRFTWHYVVVIGYTLDMVVVADPGDGKRRLLATNDFLGSWKFHSDMYGVPVQPLCVVCSGTGRWSAWDLGPLNKCDTCAGTGRAPDVLAELLAVVEVYPQTMIVPDKPVSFD